MIRNYQKCNNGSAGFRLHTENFQKLEKPAPSKSEHDHVLEHSLHQLLREVHHKNTHHPFPHPATGPLGPSKKRMMAGLYINIKLPST